MAAKTIKKGDLVYEEAAGIEVELTEVQVKAHLAVKCEEERKEGGHLGKCHLYSPGNLPPPNHPP